MVVNLLYSIGKVSVLRQGWSIFEGTNSAAIDHAFDLIPDSTDLRPLLLSQMYIHH